MLWIYLTSKHISANQTGLSNTDPRYKNIYTKPTKRINAKKQTLDYLLLIIKKTTSE